MESNDCIALTRFNNNEEKKPLFEKRLDEITFPEFMDGIPRLEKIIDNFNQFIADERSNGVGKETIESYESKQKKICEQLTIITAFYRAKLAAQNGNDYQYKRFMKILQGKDKNC